MANRADHSIYEEDSLAPALRNTGLDFDPRVPAACRLCRCPAWDPNRKDCQVDDDHLGDDRPEAVQARCRDEMTRLHESRTPAGTTGGRKDRSA